MAGFVGVRLNNVATEQARKKAAPDLTGKSWASNRFGALAVGLAMVLALATFTVFSGFTPIVPTNTIVTAILIGDALIVIVLVTIIGLALLRLRRARKTSRAGARLHARVIALFSLVAAIPAIVTATVATVAVEWTVKPGYLANFQSFINNSGQLSEFYRGFQCSTLLQNTARASDEIAQIAKCRWATRPAANRAECGRRRVPFSQPGDHRPGRKDRRHGRRRRPGVAAVAASPGLH